MKLATPFLLFALLITSESKPRERGDDNGVGFAFSGAGGRLAQHLALMESLVKGTNPSGRKIRPSYLSGASSGSISAIVLNAILETEDRQLPDGITWEYYKEQLFALTNGDIYDVSITGIAKIFAYNIPHGYILDNSNLRRFLVQYAKKMNYEKLGDLYLPTSISIVNQSSGLAERLWSNDPRVADLDLLEVIMASTAIPIAFPPATITGLGNTKWIDGGTGIDTIPVFPLLSNPNVTELYILCYGSALTSGGSGKLPYIIDDIQILSNSLATINDMRVDLFDGAIDIAADSSVKSFSYIPSLNETFSSLEFDYEQLEYNLAASWAKNNTPFPLNGVKVEKGWREYLSQVGSN